MLNRHDKNIAMSNTKQTGCWVEFFRLLAMQGSCDLCISLYWRIYMTEPVRYGVNFTVNNTFRSASVTLLSTSIRHLHSFRYLQSFNRNSHRRCSVKNDVLKNSQENTYIYILYIYIYIGKHRHLYGISTDFGYFQSLNLKSFIFPKPDGS